MQLHPTALEHAFVAAESQRTSDSRGRHLRWHPTTRQLAVAAAACVIVSALALPCAPLIIMSASMDADSWLNSLWVFDGVPTVWFLAAVGGLLCGNCLKRREPTRYPRAIANAALTWAVLTAFAGPWVLLLWVSVHQMG